MRTRKEIIKNAEEDSKINGEPNGILTSISYSKWSLEVLLDIRDLLLELKGK